MFLSDRWPVTLSIIIHKLVFFVLHKLFVGPDPLCACLRACVCVRACAHACACVSSTRSDTKVCGIAAASNHTEQVASS